MSKPRFALPLIVLAAAGAVLAGCATTPVGGAPSGPATFRTDDFSWSTPAGRGSIDGRVEYRQNGVAFACTGNVALTPDTPYTRARFQTLYGSVDRAALPEAVVRARTVPDPNADYRSFVRSTTCADGRFEFTGLPDGGWFIIAPVSAGGDRVVLMRRVQTRGGRIAVTL
ncbi:hypothetical protein [Brevundimonas lenta]|uniref:Lipoprotein n=1 Tax=Brevundimonas lenta TaxID=424796 RepID=A0A7W6NP78_9CAUL|nr:hypothetical protein [Brevundimonas lenta]MBB4081902.1 hypothetical protein [Brevundimonas lenta]